LNGEDGRLPDGPGVSQQRTRNRKAMPLIIPDEALKEVGLSESEARVEIACLLFDAGRLSLPGAARLAELERVEFEKALLQRRIPLYRPTVEDLESDLRTLDRVGI